MPDSILDRARFAIEMDDVFRAANEGESSYLIEKVGEELAWSIILDNRNLTLLVDPEGIRMSDDERMLKRAFGIGHPVREHFREVVVEEEPWDDDDHEPDGEVW